MPQGRVRVGGNADRGHRQRPVAVEVNSVTDNPLIFGPRRISATYKVFKTAEEGLRESGQTAA